MYSLKRKMYTLLSVVSLGASIRNKIKLLILFTLWWIQIVFFKQELFPKNFSFVIKKFNNTAQCYVNSFSNLGILKEIFVDCEYDIPVSSPEVILDLGSNIGFSIIFFKLKYPQAYIYGIEASPTTYQILEKNTYQFKNTVQILNKLVSDKSGKEIFFEDKESNASSSIYMRGKRSVQVEVEAMSLDKLLELIKSPIDILKFDIEGAEQKVFHSFVSFSSIRSSIGEVHLDLIDMKKEEFLDLWRSFDIHIRETDSHKRFIFFATNTSFR